jgi:hypothetical protein
MRRCIARVCTVVAFLLVVGDGLAIANAGKSCTKVGAVNKKADTICARVKGKLVWQKSSASSSGKSGFGDGTYRVGADMPAGLYSAAGSSLCYWARLSNFSGSLDSIIANSIGGGREIVELKPSDVGFKSTRCGTWSRFNPIPTTTMVEGTYKVGEEIQPGLWRTTTANTCYWARLSGFGGDLDDVISNELPSGSTALVEILATDVGFRSSRCGTWTRVG